MNGLSGGIRIGAVLRDARTRAGLDIRTVEERTKIRTKYLRALENEEWAALPSSAYAKGFLRTYAGMLGLDGEVLVDEYRRQVEGGRDAASYPLGEQVLERRRRSGEPGGPRPALLLALAAVVVIGVLLFLGLSGGDDEEPRERRDRAPAAKQQDKRDRGGGGRDKPAADGGPVRLALAIGSPVEICLLDGSKRELIDGQVIAAGTEEGPWESERFELRFPSGYDRKEIELELDGDRVGLPRAKGAAAFAIEGPGRPRPVKARRAEECP